MTGLLQPAIQFLPENQGEKTAEDVPSVGLELQLIHLLCP